MPERIEDRHRFIAWLLVCTFVFSIPWEKSVLLPSLGTLTRLLGAMAFAAVAVLAVSRRSARLPNLPLVLAVGFAGWTALTWLWSIAPAETSARLLTFAQLVAMLWMIWESCRTREQQATLMRAYVAGASVASVLTMVRYVRGLETYYLRYAAPGFDPNDLGLTVALSVPLALYLGLRDRGPVRWLYRMAVLLATAAILLSASRTALTLTAGAYLLVLWTWRQADLSAKISGVALFGLLVAGTLYLAPPASRQRLATLPAEAARGTLHDRTRIWKAGLQSRPLASPARGRLGGLLGGRETATRSPRHPGPLVRRPQHVSFGSGRVRPGRAGAFHAVAGLAGRLCVDHAVAGACRLVGRSWNVDGGDRRAHLGAPQAWVAVLRTHHDGVGAVFPAFRRARVKLRVLEVLPTLKRAGAENVAVSLACGLAPDRFETAVVSLYGRVAGGLEPVLEERGIRSWHLGKRRGLDVRIWPRLARVLREFRPDVVHTHSYVLRYVLPVVRGAAVVHTAHNLAGRDPDRVTGAFNRLAFRCGVLPVAVSAAVARSYENKYGLPPAATILNGIDIDRFHRPEAREPWRREHRFSEDDVLIASVARLEPQKDPEALIGAFARSMSGFPRSHLLMAGDGSLGDSARRTSQSKGVAGRVHFLGACADVAALLAASDLFALASRWEGSPLTVLEAMAARLPVVATAVGGVPELVEDGVTGVLVPSGDEEALGGALASLAHQPERRRAMAEAAGARVTRFSVEAMVQAYAELFSRVAGRAA